MTQNEQYKKTRYDSHLNKISLKQKPSLTSFYGKAKDSQNCLRRSFYIINKVRILNSQTHIGLSLTPTSSSGGIKYNSFDIRNIASANPESSESSSSQPNCVNLLTPIKEPSIKIFNSKKKNTEANKIDSPNFLSSQKLLIMGNAQTSRNYDKDIKDNGDCEKIGEDLQRVPSCSTITESKSDLTEVISCVIEKRPKLEHHVVVDTESNLSNSLLLNKFSLNVAINKCFNEFEGSDNSKLNGKCVPKACTCVNERKRCRTCANSSPILLDGDESTASSADNFSKSSSTDKLFDYPNSQQTGRLSITKHDVECLQPVEYLNDVIIDFYLKYINYHLLNRKERENIHIFSSFFYSRLISASSLKHKKSVVASQDLMTQRHSRICNWTRNIDIFEKDFILIPINQHHHWFLAIICFPGKCAEIFNQFHDKSEDLRTIELKISENLVNQKKRPCILIFDSLCPNPERWDVATILREYLQVEWNLRKNSIDGSKIFIKRYMRGNSVKSPQQANSYDCGCYLLLYAEYFFTKPIQTYHLPIKTCVEWFSKVEASKMRDKLKKIIHELTIQYKNKIT